MSIDAYDGHTGIGQTAARQNDVFFHLAVTVYTSAVFYIGAAHGHLSLETHVSYLSRFGVIYLFTLPLFSAVVVYGLQIHRFGERQRRVLMALAPPSPGHFVSGLGILLSFTIMLGSYTAFKTMMPEIRGGFVFDLAQANLDRWVHFGIDPGTFLASLGLGPAVRGMLVWNYSFVWSLFVFIPLYFIATGRIGQGIRLRYFISIMALWVLAGNVLACIFLSAGPAFYEHVTGDTHRFAALMAFVRDSGSGFGTPANFQAQLWSNHTSGQASLGSGISAFPSMHVGMAMMNALFLRERSRRLGWLGFAYVGIILVSSVWLGWHYAIDGYVAILVTTLVYVAIKAVFGLRPSTHPSWLPARHV